MRAAGSDALGLWLTVLAAAGSSAWCAGTAHADGVGIVAHQAAEAPASASDVGIALGRVAREGGVSATLQPFRAARAQLEIGAVPKGRLAEFRRLRELVAEGWRAYLAVEPAYAASRLSEARRMAERVLSLDGGTEAYADVSLRLAVVLLDLQRRSEAAELFRIAALLTPERRVTLSEFSPDVVAAHEAAVQGQEPEARVRIEVALEAGTETAPAQVELDGKRVGTAPVSMSLPVGQHVVAARATGHVAGGRAFAVSTPGIGETGEQVVRLELDRDEVAAAVLEGPSTLAVGRAEIGARVAVEGLLLYGDFDAVLLVASVWRRGAPALLGQWCRSLPASCGSVVEIGYDAPENLPKAARRLWESVRVQGKFPPTLLVDARLVSGESAPGKTNGNGKGGGMSWWKWALAGVGASAAIVVTGLVLTRDTEIRPVFTGDPCDFGGC